MIMHHSWGDKEDSFMKKIEDEKRFFTFRRSKHLPTFLPSSFSGSYRDENKAGKKDATHLFAEMTDASVFLFLGEKMEIRKKEAGEIGPFWKKERRLNYIVLR